jgi:nicotinamidase-related amidase
MSTLPHAVDRRRGETQRLQHARRDAGLFLCYCATVFRPGYVEISERTRSSVRVSTGQPRSVIPCSHSLGSASGDEVVVGKHRVNALYGTALDLILRANTIDTLMILGYATSGVVLSTVRYAADLDYRLVVIEDCCADQEPDVHDFLTQRICPRQAEVVTSVEVIAALTP